jgi:paraquat-inducible protein B
MTTQQYPTAQIRPKSRFSLIWLIPLLAALIAGWLVYKYYSERGSIITITFDSAAGIEAKKTPIRYKDVQVGKVKKVSLSDDLKKVTVTAEIFPEMASHLGEETRFWIEKPRVTLKGISGLDTLLSGVHISLDPGEVEGMDSIILEHYDGLTSPPIFTSGEEGSLLTLNTQNLGSLAVGSPVYFHKINVGEVTSFKLNERSNNASSKQTVDVSIYIRAPYDKNIKTNTRFWNASGIDVSLTSSGVSVQMESLTSLLIGGIAFETPANELGYALDGNMVTFKLYETSKLAKDDTQRLNKLFYTMYFEDSLHGLTEDSLIEYNGVSVGKVESILLKNRFQTTQQDAQIKTVVKVSLRIDKFSPKSNKEVAEKTLQELVSQGLQGQLAVASLVTGAKYISLSKVKSDLTERYVLKNTSYLHSSIFPTTAAKTSLLNFDASKMTDELNKTLVSVNNLINSKDIKKTLKGLAATSSSLDKITRQLAKKGFSGELVKTLANSQKAIKEISVLIGDSRKTMRSLSNASNKLQKDASHSMKTFSNVSNKLQRDTSKTLSAINHTLKSTLSEDSAMQYKLQQLMNDLSEASNSFSVLADTIQRKPNSVIIGK